MAGDINSLNLLVSSAKQGKSGSIYNLVKVSKVAKIRNRYNQVILSCLGRANLRAFHENPNRIHTEVTFINP